MSYFTFIWEIIVLDFGIIKNGSISIVELVVEGPFLIIFWLRNSANQIMTVYQKHSLLLL